MLGFLLAACSKESSNEIAFDRGDVPDEVIMDFETTESDSGLALWKLTAPKADRFTDKKLILLDKPRIEFFDENGAHITTLISDLGEYSIETRDMLAFGNVRVETVDGDILETDSLLWLNGRDKIISNSFVKLIRGRDVVTGYGLECDPNLNSVDIKRDVKATIIDEAGEVRE